MKLNNECVHYISTINIYALIDTNEDLWYVQIEKISAKRFYPKLHPPKNFDAL